MKTVVDDKSIFVFELSQFSYRKYLGEKLLKKAKADLVAKKKGTALVAAKERADTLQKEADELRAKLIGRDAKNEVDTNSGPARPGS